MKTFRKFIETPLQQLDEDSWLSKGYALGQSSRHSATRQQIASVLSTINSLCEKGKSERDIVEKLNLLFHAIQEITRVYRGFSELSQNNINASVASTVLSDDLKKVIASEFAKIERNRH